MSHPFNFGNKISSSEAKKTIELQYFLGSTNFDEFRSDIISKGFKQRMIKQKYPGISKEDFQHILQQTLHKSRFTQQQLKTLHQQAPLIHKSQSKKQV